MTKFNAPLLRFFWPTELRIAVDKLKNQKILNDQALIFLRKKILNRHIVLWLVSLLFITTGEGIVHPIGIVMLIGSPLLVKFDIWLFYQRQMRAYVTGEKIEVISLGTSKSLFNMQLINFTTKNLNGVEGKIKLYEEPRLKKGESIPSGERISVYYDSSSKAATPDINYIKNLCSVNAQLLEKKS